MFSTYIFQEKEFLDVINLEYGHRCRADPVEAAIYSLQAKGEYLDKFKANASAELTVELEETVDEAQKIKYSSVELPLDFTKEYLEKVDQNHSSYETTIGDIKYLKYINVTL